MSVIATACLYLSLQLCIPSAIQPLTELQSQLVLHSPPLEQKSQNLCRGDEVITCLLVTAQSQHTEHSNWPILISKTIPTMKEPSFICISHLHPPLFGEILQIWACASSPCADSSQFLLPLILVCVTVANVWKVQATLVQATFTLLEPRRGASPVRVPLLGPSDGPDVWCSVWKKKRLPKSAYHRD